MKKIVVFLISIAIVVFCGMIFAKEIQAAGIIARGPYLQPTEDLGTSVGVAWRTSADMPATINYGINSVNENSLNTAVNTKHYIKLTGLTPGAVYQYQVSAGGETSPVYRFKTSPPDGKFKAIVGSDWHFPGSKYPAVYNDMLAFDPDVVFIVGDLVEYGNRPEDYEGMFSAMRELFATAIVAPVPGNHEWNYDTTYSLYLDNFYLPENGPVAGKERTYSFDFGKSHFSAVDYNDYTNDSWISADLAAAKAKGNDFIFLGRHYSHGSSFIEGRPSYDLYGVDIAFNGHNHAYARTFPVKNSTTAFDRYNSGVVMESGNSYHGLGTIYQQFRSLTYQKDEPLQNLHVASASGVSNNGYIGYSQLTVDGNRATVNSFRYSEKNSPAGPRELEDSYIIDKSSTQLFTPQIFNIAANSVTAYRASVSWQTDIASRGEVEFGTSSGVYAYKSHQINQRQIFTTSHQIKLEALKPGTTYYYRVKSWLAGKESVSGEKSFTTPSSAASGELVAEFDFGGIMHPLYGTRVSDGGYEPSVRQGWIMPSGTNPWDWSVGCSIYTYVPVTDANSTYCAVVNRGKLATWKTDLSNGEYDIELTAGNAGYFFGPTKIDVENGQVFLEEPIKPAYPNNTLYKKVGTVSVSDGSLDLLVGYGQSGISDYTPINSLKIWTKGYLGTLPPSPVADTQPPTVPAGISANAMSSSQINLAWSASTDNVGVAGYRIYRNGTQIGTSVSNSYLNTGLSSDTSYLYTIIAYDAAGNISAQSSSVSATTNSAPISAISYYVSAYGNDLNSGSLVQPFKTITKALSIARAGDAVVIRGGTYNEKVIFPYAGEGDNKRIVLKAYPSENVIITRPGRIMDIDKNYITVEGIIFDGQWGADDAIKIYSTGNYAVLKNCEVRNTMRDAVDMSAPVGVIVDGCKIHDAIWVVNGVRDDAHGIVTGGVKDLVIKNTEIYYVSGDAIQLQYGGWNNVVVENSKLWNAPLPSARGGAPAGVYAGENAIDTKYYPTDGRGKLYMNNVTAYGWRSTYIVNAAAFNLKHNIEAVLDGITTYDNDIAFRVRGPGSSGDAQVIIKNAVIYGSDRGVRYEDMVQNLKIYNSTWGKNITKAFESAGGYGLGYEAKNNLFILGNLPAEASDASNKAVGDADFENSFLNDYRLKSSSSAVNRGVALSGVTRDRNGVVRPQGGIYDIGAFEFTGVAGTTRYNISHFVNLFSNWMKFVSGALSDINSDGVTNSRDLGKMMSNWE